MRVCRRLLIVLVSFSVALVGDYGVMGAKPTLAVCHGPSPFKVTGSSAWGAQGQEEAKLGVCNNNGGYQSRLRRSWTPPLDPSACFIARYETALGVYQSNPICDGTWRNGPIISGDSLKNGPLYFCAMTYDGINICGDGPWTNKGY